MRYQVLGPLRVWVGDEPVPLSRRHRTLLAVLLREPGQVVGADRLVDAFWADEPPPTARNQVQIAVYRLRRRLAAAGAGPDLVASEPAGYLLRAAADEVDAWRFDALVDEGRALLRTGELLPARDRLRAGLALWRGEPFADVDSAVVAPEATRLEQRRLTVWEECLDLEMSLGRHHVVVDELAGLVAAHPTRERLRGLLMVALYRCGRQVEALAAFRDGRQWLTDQVGVEPGAELVELHQRILRGDPALVAADRPQPSATAGTRTGRFDTLPRAVADFTGRRAEVAHLVAALTGVATGPPVAVVEGTAGSGKTALAVHVSHLLADRAPHGRLFLDLHGHSPGRAPLGPREALGALLRALGVRGERLPQETTDRAALWQSELAGRHVLVVLDNALDAAQVTPLLPGIPGCMVLVTARRRLTGLAAAHTLTLDCLPAADAETLFAAVVGHDRVAAEPEAAAEVVQRCARLPLAVRIAASRLAHRPSWTIRYLADRLADTDRRLGELAHGGRGVAAAIALSYDQLTAPQQRTFRLFGHHVGDELDARLAAAALDTPLADAEDALRELADAHLVAQPAPGRYRQHDLLRRYAQDLAAHHGDRCPDETLGRIVDHYAAAAAHAADLIHPDRGPTTATPAYPSRTLPPLPDRTTARAWLETERPNLVAAVTAAADHGWPERAWWLADALWPFLEWAGHADDWQTTHRRALAAWHDSAPAAASDVPATLHERLGQALRRAGRPQEAVDHHREALALRRAAGDRTGEAWALNHLGLAYKDLGQHRQALATQQEAVETFRATGARGLATALVNLATVHNRVGQYRDAVRRCEEALAATPSEYAAALAYQAAGYAHLRLGDHTEALRHLRRSEELYRETGNEGSRGELLSDLGLAYAGLGRYDEALTHHRRALDMSRRFGRTRGECQARNELASTLRAMGRHADAAAHARQALALARQTGLRHDEAVAHDELAHALATTDPTTARHHRHQATTIHPTLLP